MAGSVRLVLIIAAGFILAVALTALTYWIWPAAILKMPMARRPIDMFGDHQPQQLATGSGTGIPPIA